MAIPSDQRRKLFDGYEVQFEKRKVREKNLDEFIKERKDM